MDITIKRNIFIDGKLAEKGKSATVSDEVGNKLIRMGKAEARGKAKSGDSKPGGSSDK